MERKRLLTKLARLFSDFVRVVALVPVVERKRRRVGPAAALTDLRRRRSRPRDARERHLLRRVIQVVDRALPDGGNCYRRVLLEVALDRGAADEQVCFGLRAGGGPQSGHAWLPSWGEPAQRYDVTFRL